MSNILTINFNKILEKLILYNPSFVLRGAWKIIER